MSSQLTLIFQGDDADVTCVAPNYFYQKNLRVSLEYQDADATSNSRTKSKELFGKSIVGRV